MHITAAQYLSMQPGSPTVALTDRFYHAVSKYLAHLWDETGLFAHVAEDTRIEAVLAVVGYYQDIVADAGLWRTFTAWHTRHHGSPLPHYDRSDDYVDYELNLDDVRYLLWYTLEGDESLRGTLSPHDDDVDRLARAMHAVLDELYDKAPTPTDYTLIAGVDPDDPAEAQATYDFMHWLYWRSYLMRRSSREAAQAHMDEAHALIARYGERDAVTHLHDLNDRIMATTPIGPVPLSIAQWTRLITGTKE